MTIKIFITDRATGITKSWDDIPEREQKKISKALNYQALTSLGYVPKIKEKEEAKP